MARYQLAQLYVARLLAPIDSPALADFVAKLDPVNALADAAPGFVWRLQTDEGNATSIQAYDDEMIIVNMSVWEDLAALSAFVYRSDHRDVMVRRREWFERLAEAYLVLWWVPEGHIPGVEEAVERLELLRKQGPTADAFTPRQPFAPPDA